MTDARSSPLIPYQVGDRDDRPWGCYEVVAVGKTQAGEDYCEKKITVLPGQILSLQSHDLRREVWRVLEGELTVVLNDRHLTLGQGEEVRVPQRSFHAMGNLGSFPCIVFERQEGLCREEDIRRYLDAYGRATEISDDPAAAASLRLYKNILSRLR